MTCVNHPEVEATASCVYCGKFFCSACLVEVDGKNYCKTDVGKMVEETKAESSRQSPEKIIVQALMPSEKKSSLKTAAKVLVIIFGIIGIIWGFSGPVLAGCSAAAIAISESSNGSSNVSSTAASLVSSAGKLLASLVFIVAGMVLGLVASSSTIKKTSTIVLGSLVIVMGVISTILLQYVAGPVYVLAGVLALVAGLKQKEYVQSE